jgi:ATP-dependent Clp protease ATP-binding subunit ClpC
MTSNVGVAESLNRGKSIGFSVNNDDFSKSIIEKELKKTFKPEFLNRIQKIVYFNKLEEESLKQIINLEIQKLSHKVEELGHHLSNDLTEGKIIDDIYSNISKNKEYGARPIVNEVQRMIEDKIVDYLIDNDVEDNHTFTYQELANLD